MLAGPLRHAGQEAAAQRAAELESDGQNDEAAAVLVDIAQSLEQQELPAVAVNYRIRAASLLAAANENARAETMLEEIAWEQLSVRGPSAQGAISELRRVGTKPWLADGLEAIAAWPRLPWARKYLDAAIEADTEPARLLRWRAARVQIELVFGEAADVIELTDELPAELASGARLELELDRIDAYETVGEQGRADQTWGHLLAWLDTEGDDRDRAIAWQRRALVLATRGESSSMRDAFLRAIAGWARDDGAGRHAADAFFSLDHARALLDEFEFDPGGRALARSLRASAPPPPADELLDAAMSQLIANNLRTAHENYWLALAQFRKVGDLLGMEAVYNHLAELYARSKRPVAALRMALLAGNAKRAADLARPLSPKEVTEALVDLRAPWQRRACYEVLTTLNANVPVGTAAKITDALLEDSAAATSARPGSLPAAALEALAWIFLQIPGARRDAVASRLHEGARIVHLMDARYACAQALVNAHQLQLLASPDDLVDLFLADPHARGIPMSWLAQRMSDDRAIRSRMIDAARGGNERAAHALMWLQPHEHENGTWASVADPLARAALDVSAFAESELDGSVEIAHNLSVNFEPGARAGRWASPEVRAKLAHHLAAEVTTEEAAESSRASAMQSLALMMPALDRQERDYVCQIAVQMADGGYRHSDIESADVDPLSNVHTSRDSVGMLQAAALRTLAVAEETAPGELEQDLQGLLDRAFTLLSPRVRSAALDLLSRVPRLTATVDLESALEDQSDDVRYYAIRAARARQPTLLQRHRRQLAHDPSEFVRREILAEAEAANDRAILTAIATADDDAILRHMAQLALVRVN